MTRVEKPPLQKSDPVKDHKTVAREAKEAAEKKKKMRLKIAAGVVVVLALFVWWGLQPLKAGPVYGLCKTYIELQLRYPMTYKVTQYDEFGTSMRLFFTYIDSFGVQRSRMVECVAHPDPVNGYVVDEIKIDRKSIGPKKIAAFNLTVPGILAGEPDTKIPRYKGDDFSALKND